MTRDKEEVLCRQGLALLSSRIRKTLYNAFTSFSLSDYENIYLIGWGKGAETIAQNIQRLLGKKISNGIILNASLEKKVSSVQYYLADHPLPSRRNVIRSRQLLHLVESATKNDLVIAISCGGGSAMFEIPRRDISVKTLKTCNRLLLREGCNPRVTNYVRRKLSQVKGGGLLEHISAQNIMHFIVSDDVRSDSYGKPEAHVASGPLYMGRYPLLHKEDIPHAIRPLLKITSQGRKRWRGFIMTYVLADNSELQNCYRTILSRKGYAVFQTKHPYSGESQTCMSNILKHAVKTATTTRDAFAYVTGGEAMVRTRGNGRGGRCQHMAAVALMAKLEPSWTVICLASDGSDNIPTVSGAVAEFPATINPKPFIRSTNTYELHKKAGSLLLKVHPHHNVGDIVICLRKRPNQ